MDAALSDCGNRDVPSVRQRIFAYFSSLKSKASRRLIAKLDINSARLHDADTKIISFPQYQYTSIPQAKSDAFYSQSHGAESEHYDNDWKSFAQANKTLKAVPSADKADLVHAHLTILMFAHINGHIQLT